jgi:anti-anti-sigma factor
MPTLPPGDAVTPLDLTVRFDDGRAVIVIEGEVDHHTCETLRRVSHGVLAAGVASVTFDCAHLTFLDAGGLRVFCDVVTVAEQRGGSVALEGTSASTRRLLAVSGLGERLVIR